MRSSAPTPRLPGWALLCLVPLPSLGGAAAMWWWPDSPWGKGLYGFSKVLLLTLPLFWHRYIDRGRWHLNTCRKQGLNEGLLTGVGMIGVIWIMGLLAAKRWVDVDLIMAQLALVGFDSLGLFLLLGLYWCTLNAILEEMVWRWFVLRQFQEKAAAPFTAILLASAAFTLHHLVVVRSWASWPITLILNAGVFGAGVVWGWLTLRHRSILPACISHILADIGIVSLGFFLFF